MWLSILVGCAPVLPDHCVTTRGPDGVIRERAERDMSGKELASATLFASSSVPVAEVAYTYTDGLWVLSELDSTPGDDAPTQDQRLTYDAEGRVVERLVVELPANTLLSSFTYTWDGDRLASTTNETPFTSWDETWTWTGDEALVIQRFTGGNVVGQVRAFEPSPLTWPVLDPDRDLPGLAFTSIGVDADGDGLTSESERVYEQELDAGIPVFSRFYDTSGDLVSQTDWDTCPES